MSVLVRNVSVGIALGMLAACFFLIGIYTSCSQGGGTVILTNLACSNFNVIDVCEVEGSYYEWNPTTPKQPDFTFNTSFVGSNTSNQD